MVPESPPPTDNIHHGKGNEKSVQNTSTKPMTLITNLKLSQKKSPSQQQNMESNTSTTTPVTLKTPFHVDKIQKVLTSIRNRSRSQLQSYSTTTELPPRLHSNSAR